MAGKNGGARPGAGRPRKRVTHAKPIKEAEKRCADFLPQALENLKHLANGGYEVVEEKWELREVFVDDVDQDGEPIRVARNELTLVEKKVTRAPKCRASNIYLADRTMGKPRQREERADEVSGTLKIVVEYADPNIDEVDSPPTPPGAEESDS